MITIIATIKPEHLDNIRARRKTYEVRKTIPKVELPFRVLCCESGSGGKIKAEFLCDHVTMGKDIPMEQLIKESCVTMEQAVRYAGGKKLCFWHITNMIDYCSTKGHRVRNISEFGLTRAPQSWQYVKEKL